MSNEQLSEVHKYSKCNVTQRSNVIIANTQISDDDNDFIRGSNEDIQGLNDEIRLLNDEIRRFNDEIHGLNAGIRRLNNETRQLMDEILDEMIVRSYEDGKMNPK